MVDCIGSILDWSRDIRLWIVFSEEEIKMTVLVIAAMMAAIVTLEITGKLG
jgi:hypothetical protein